ncbi:MAG: cysteine desulfurase family protein [Clostridiaceae bacterium]|nr:cysteine desulfurase family protein [Clostridiaceae bacterium]
MPIYLDHSATTRPKPAVIACLAAQLADHYANPASLHRLGQAEEKNLKTSKQTIAGLLDCRPEQLYLTSGGSESINWAIKGTLWGNRRRGGRLIISGGEHAAVRETAASFETQGSPVVRLPLTSAGTVDLDSLEQALQEPAALISLILVSNETGAVNPVSEIVRLRDRLQPDTPIHLDAVQTFGKLPFSFSQSGVDLMSGSGHKVGAPKGIGWLVKKEKCLLQPLIHGGGQQGGLRSGTENPPFAAALALAMTLTADHLPEKIEHVAFLRQILLKELAAEQTEPLILSPAGSVPHILAAAFPGLRGETLLHALEAREIYLSTGAACSSRRSKGNTVLKAMGVSDADALCAVRISISPDNTEAEMLETARAIAESCRKFRR